ncbi:MAG: DNA-binding response regulator [Pseudomonadota bacterium]|nr:DNA-binding response regulator [Pseudomonadota bacterium]
MPFRLSQDHFAMIFLLFVVIASGADLIADLSHGAASLHLVQEATILFLAAGALLWIVWRLRRNRYVIQALNAELESIKELQQPQEVLEAKRRLGEVIATQFDAWQLSESEKEVGMLLLKGFSLKEIASLRGTAEKTIRQQASAVYKKANLSGRHAFAAWFIEDFL